MLDRIDIQINVPSLEYDTLKESSTNNQSSADLYEGVQRAVQKQRERFSHPGEWNAFMTSEAIEKYCILTPSAEELIKKAFDRLRLSMRGYHKILKVARTIADLSGEEMINDTHIREAIVYRSLDKNIEQMKS